jgi:hypothetical protein
MRKGFVESVLGGYVYFKSAANAKAEKLDAELLSAVTLNIKGRTKEYHRLKIYLGGKESTRISDYYMWLL